MHPVHSRFTRFIPKRPRNNQPYPSINLFQITCGIPDSQFRHDILLTAALRARVEEFTRSSSGYDPSSSRWQDDNDWDEPPRKVHSQMPSESPIAESSKWPAAVSAGLLVAKWLWFRRYAFWPCFGLGLVASVAIWHGHPVIRATLAAVSAAADVIPIAGRGSH